jgi:predicted phosphodiesterase
VKIQTKGKTLLVEQALAAYPDLPTRTLARMLYQDHKELWPNLEAARRSVMHKRGNNGKRSHGWKVNEPFQRPNQPAGFTWKFPDTLAKEWPAYELKAPRTLVLSDIHIPFHDPPAVKAAIEAGRRYQPECILLNGDTVDFFAISRFDKDPTVTSPIHEIKCTREFLGWLRQEFPKAQIIYKLGNHDERLAQYFYRKAPELLGIKTIELSHLLTAENVLKETSPAIPNIEFITEQRKIKAGHLSIYHGHEIGKGSIAPPVNPARGLFMRTLECGLMGHLHKDSSHNETTANGKLISCWSTGCLCGLWPDYAKVNKWTHSAAIVELSGENFTVHPLRILGGKVL